MIRFYWSMCPQAVLCESYASFTAHVLHGPDMGHCAPKPSDMLIDWLRQFIFQRPITKWLLALYFLKLYLAVVCRCSSMRIEDRCCQYEATTLSERGSREAGLPTPGFHFRQQCPPCTGCQRTSGGLSFAAVTPNFVSSHLLLSSLRVYRNIESRVSSLKNRVSSLRSRVSSLKNRVSSLRSRVSSLKSRVSSL